MSKIPRKNKRLTSVRSAMGQANVTPAPVADFGSMINWTAIRAQSVTKLAYVVPVVAVVLDSPLATGNDGSSPCQFVGPVPCAHTGSSEHLPPR
jgi:hypothetical protein